jgi:hypothetical protein
VNPVLSAARCKLSLAVEAAYRRGVTDRRGLETVIAVELALCGLELACETRLSLCPSIAGTHFTIELYVKELSRGPAKIYSLHEGRALRRCAICEGPGCLWCDGQGWKPLDLAR